MSFLTGEGMTGGYGGADIIHGCTIRAERGEVAVIVAEHRPIDVLPLAPASRPR